MPYTIKTSVFKIKKPSTGEYKEINALLDSDSAKTVYYGVSTTSASTQTKTVTIEGISELSDGLNVRVLFSNAQSYSGTPKLQINSTTASNILWRSGAEATTLTWNAGDVLDFVYNSASSGFIAINSDAAPIDHASSGTTYGKGTNSNYGHVKLTDSLTDTTPAATGGLALSAKAGADLKGAITKILPVITGNTNNSGYTINSGEYFEVNGTLYKASASIPQNSAWSGSATAQSDTAINDLNTIKATKKVASGTTSFAALDNNSYSARALDEIHSNITNLTTGIHQTSGQSGPIYHVILGKYNDNYYSGLLMAYSNEETWCSYRFAFMNGTYKVFILY